MSRFESSTLKYTFRHDRRSIACEASVQRGEQASATGGALMSMTSGLHSARRQAFTLVELLVVIGIIALLISILMPALNRAREMAQRTQCAATIRQFYNGDLAYLQESKRWHVPGFFGNPAAQTATASPHYSYNRIWSVAREWRPALNQPTVTDNVRFGYVTKDLMCPTAVSTRAWENMSVAAPDSTTGYWLYPPHVSYGMNVEGIDEIGTSTPPTNSQVIPQPPLIKRTLIHAYMVGDVKRPSEKLMWVDAIWSMVNVWGSGIDKNPSLTGWRGKKSDFDKIGERQAQANEPYDSTRTTAWRHRGGANVCYFDGHVEWLPKDKIYSYDSGGNIVPNNGLWKVME
jgi:prepilin-type processing-associated H-X9-DG protein/prepilin-type N-terminal cleavage/methylation domain-containing protein